MIEKTQRQTTVDEESKRLGDKSSAGFKTV